MSEARCGSRPPLPDWCCVRPSGHVGNCRDGRGRRWVCRDRALADAWAGTANARGLTAPDLTALAPQRPVPGHLHPPPGYASYACRIGTHHGCAEDLPREAATPGVVYESCGCGCHSRRAGLGPDTSRDPTAAEHS
ncbi:hypothetical protein QNO07_05400 [Streptomyces sp. 549]|uniref:hypothetical protein n=1 Tax=Streptomyces sp. 549 TaxID=3049076 RepID=UPI0024C2D971|nr:hypothetical protein [Streptomyces sp. 549]MDK1472871.1 hypothetical protein [Streptomyces sp. 549]